MNFCTAA